MTRSFEGGERASEMSGLSVIGLLGEGGAAVVRKVSKVLEKLVFDDEIG